ncbi:MAG: hypothetical protein WC470_00305 [Candidatus Paceibacterota bacterium]
MEEDKQKINSTTPAKNNAANLIYHDFGGLADEIDDVNDAPSINGKNKLEIEKRKLILENREERAAQKEKVKTESFFERYKTFPQDKQKEIIEGQKTAEQIIGRYIKDEKDIEGLSEEERFVLNKIRNQYRDFKKSGASEPFSFDLADETDKLVYGNLIYDISFRIVGLESPIKRIKQVVREPKKIIEKEETNEISPGDLDNKLKELGEFEQEKDIIAQSGESEERKEPKEERKEKPISLKTEKTLVEIKPRNKAEPEIDLAAKFLSIEYLRRKENILDAETAEEIMAIIRDWVYYGGDFYKYWTGRAMKLKKGVDYEINGDGSVNEESFALARNKRVEEWLKQTINRTWIAEANEFKEMNADKMAEKRQKVEIKDEKGRVHEQEKYTAPYFCEYGWLFYESNYYDVVNGAMTQKGREPSKYRIYFNVENQDIMRVYSDIVAKLSADEDLGKYGFALNTIAMFNPSADVVAEAMNQKDKIILFVGEKGIDRALVLLQEYVQKNRAKFGKKGILLAQKFFDREGKEVFGISVSSDTKGVSPDSSRGFPKYKSFNYMQSEIIQSALDSVFKEIYNFDNLDKIGFINPQLRDKLLQIGHDGKLEDYLPMFLSQQSGVNFLIKNLVRFYPKWSKAFGMSARNMAFREEEK